MQFVVFWFTCHWSIFLLVPMTISQQWCKIMGWRRIFDKPLSEWCRLRCMTDSGANLNQHSHWTGEWLHHYKNYIMWLYIQVLIPTPIRLTGIDARIRIIKSYRQLCDAITLAPVVPSWNHLHWTILLAINPPHFWQNGGKIVDDNYKCNFGNENELISIFSSLKFIPCVWFIRSI